MRTAGIQIAIVVAILLAVEFGARIWDWSPRPIGADAGDRVGSLRYEHYYGGSGDLTPNQDGHWIVWYHRPYHVQSNADGLRNSEAVRKDAFRILALGDSQTFGPYLANDDTWPAWTENRLRRALATRDGVQVLNGGVSGYTIFDELALLKDKGVAAKPDLVLIAVFENDLPDLKREKGGRVTRPLPRGPIPGLSTKVRVALEHFAIYNVVRDVRRNVEMARAGVDLRRGEADPIGGKRKRLPDVAEKQLAARYVALFSETVALLRQNGIPLGVIFIPAAQQVAANPADSQMEPIIRKAAEHHGVPFLSVVPAFRANPEAPTRYFLLQQEPVSGNFTGNGHLSREGNAVIGATVADWLVESGLVPFPARTKQVAK